MDNEPINVIARGQRIGPSMTKRSKCALVKIHRELQRAIMVVEDEMQLRDGGLK